MGFFTPSDTASKEEATALLFDSSFSRCATKADSGSYIDSVSFGDQTDFWVHVEGPWRYGDTLGSSTKSSLFVFLDNTGAEIIRLIGDYGANSGTGNWQLQYSLAGVWTNLAAAFSTSASRQIFDFHIVCDSASGSVDCYVAGTHRSSSGTVDLSGITEVAQLRGRSGSYPGNTAAYSQIIIADEPTIGWKIGTIVMTGQGSTHTFTTGGFNNIDETIYADGDFIQSDTAAQVELFTGTPVPSFTGYVIKAVAVTARAKTSGAGPTKMRLCLRSGGTTYDNGSDITLDFGYGAFCAVWNQNPNGPADWASTDIASLEYGVKSVT
jgi:hypothetical protein